MKSRFFALVLALLLVISNYPVTTAFAAEYEDDERTIESIELTATRDLTEGVDGYLDCMDEGDYFWYSVTDTEPVADIIFSDGTIEENVSWQLLWDYFNDYNFVSEQSYQNQFKLGENTTTIRFTFFDYWGEKYYVDSILKFNIVKNPVESFSVVIKDTLIENISGCYEDLYGSDDNVIGQFFYYNIDNLDKEITVKYTDGTTKTYTESELYEATDYYGLHSDTNQYEEHLKLGKNTFKFSYMGKEAECVVEVVETPVKSIKAVANRSLIENVDGSVRSRYNTETDSSEEYFGYSLYKAAMVLEVTYKNGNVETYRFADIFGNYGYGLDYPIYFDGVQYSYYDIYYAPELKLGENKIKVSYMNCETDLVVSVIENPIKSISLNCGPITELDSYEDWDDYYDEETGEDGEIWFDAYDVPADTSTLTINYKDSTKAPDTLLLKDVVDTLGYDVYTTLPQSGEKPLTVGKYKGTAEFMGLTCEFDFEIKPNPVKSISAKATKQLIEKRDGQSYQSENDLYFIYDIVKTEPEVTINYNDGTSKTYSYAEITNIYPDFRVSSKQSLNNQFKVGENTATVTCARRTCEFNFTIVEDKIESLVLTPTVNLVENVDGYYASDYDGKEWFAYDLEKLAPTLTINYKDGSKKVYDYLTIKRYTDFDFSELNWCLDQAANPLKVGENTLKLHVLGREVEMKFNVVAPSSNLKVKSLEVIAERPLLENSSGYVTSDYLEETDDWVNYFYYYLDAISYTAKITYEDGSVKTLTGLSDCEEIEGSLFEIVSKQSYDNQFKVGKNKVTATYRGVNCEFEVEVVANPYTAIELSGEDELFVTLTKADGTKETHKVVAINYDEIVTESGIVFSGCFNHYFVEHGDETTVEYSFQLSDKDRIIVSNRISDNNWLNLAFGLDSIASNIALYADGYSEQFYGREFTGIPSGAITGTMVDDVLSICSLNYNSELSDEKGNYTYIDLDLAKYYASWAFDPERFDFTSSPMYDAKTGLIKVYGLNGYEGGISNEKLEYKDDMFIYTANFDSNYTTKAFTVIVRYENGVYFIDSISIHGAEDHIYDDGVVVKESTCTVKGTKLFTCECGATYTEALALAPHKNVYVGTKDVHAKCSVCGETNADHIYTKTEVIKEATATEKGKEKLTCDCGYSYEIETEIHELGSIEIEVDKSNDFAGTVSSVVDVKAKLELTPNEKALIASGETLELVFKLDDIGIKVDTAEKEAIANALGEKKLGAFLDISLIKQIGNYEGKVEKLNAPIRVSLTLPKELINTDESIERIYKVLRYHDGDANKVTVLDATFDKATGTILFETDRFSTYALVYEDVEAGKDEVPNAGVVSTTVIWLGAMSVSGIGALALARKKKED